MQIRRDTQYSLRIAPGERAELDALAERAGVPLSVALRVGARAWLTGLITGAPLPPTPTVEPEKRP